MVKKKTTQPKVKSDIKDYDDMTDAEKKKYDQEEADFKALSASVLGIAVKSQEQMEAEAKEEAKKKEEKLQKEIVMSSNWFGHPADMPMRLILKEHVMFNDTQLYSLNWFCERTGLFWGSYDIPTSSIPKLIVAKIRLQDENLEKYNILYFKDAKMKELVESGLKTIDDPELKALATKLKVCCAVF